LAPQAAPKPLGELMVVDLTFSPGQNEIDQNLVG
jgi:hypothetical protein